MKIDSDTALLIIGRSGGSMTKQEALEALPQTELTVYISGKPEETVQVIVDGDYDGEWFKQLKWIYRPATRQIICNSGDFKNASLAHIVARPPTGYWVRFRNGNPLDCRSANLQIATPKEIMAYRKQSSPRPWRHPLQPKNTKHGLTRSGYRGVRRDVIYNATGPSPGRTYMAYYKQKYLGSSFDPKACARMYDTAVYEECGEQALPVLNFPDEIDKLRERFPQHG